MATDGFWALPTELQLQLIINPERKFDSIDDASYILFE
jgi:hypothetical protein